MEATPPAAAERWARRPGRLAPRPPPPSPPPGGVSPMGARRGRPPPPAPIKRRVSRIDWRRIELPPPAAPPVPAPLSVSGYPPPGAALPPPYVATPFTPFPGLDVSPLPVYHGGAYVCTAFLFGGFADGAVVAYLSDVSAVPDDVYAALLAVAAPPGPGLRLLIIDALSRTPHAAHWSLGQAVAWVARFRRDGGVAAAVRAVGMSCEVGDHAAVNAELAALPGEGGPGGVRLAYDGERFVFDGAGGEGGGAQH
ncbi:hypothetical protein I4F81_011605 [Pyropia yezoensis]|uniref:Uncharacterized protein n=1 Tax=Pyropia yezoensis TaxID=2788 RepID=A0ACC3CGB1_PYRYE|nr:hypothetical protein I4F81_011605 [Neopyropia yezoensis]